MIEKNSKFKKKTDLKKNKFHITTDLKKQQIWKNRNYKTLFFGICCCCCNMLSLYKSVFILKSVAF